MSETTHSYRLDYMLVKKVAINYYLDSNAFGNSESLGSSPPSQLMFRGTNGTETQRSLGEAARVAVPDTSGFQYFFALQLYTATSWIMVAFGVHLLLGGAYELRTVVAMSVRTVVWGGIVAIAFHKPDGVGATLRNPGSLN